MILKIPFYKIIKLQPLIYTIKEIHPNEFYSTFKDADIEEDFLNKREILELTFKGYQIDGETRNDSYAILSLSTIVTLEIFSSIQEIKEWVKKNKDDEFLYNVVNMYLKQGGN